MDKLAFLVTQQQAKQELIYRADYKASAFLVVLGILTTGFINIFYKLNVVWQRYTFTISFCLVLLISLLIIILKVFLPRVVKTTAILLIKDISKFSFEKYKRELNELNDNNLYDALVEQSYFLNKLIIKKNFYLSITFLLLLLLVLILVFGVICLMI